MFWYVVNAICWAYTQHLQGLIRLFPCERLQQCKGRTWTFAKRPWASRMLLWRTPWIHSKAEVDPLGVWLVCSRRFKTALSSWTLLPFVATESEPRLFLRQILHKCEGIGCRCAFPICLFPSSSEQRTVGRKKSPDTWRCLRLEIKSLPLQWPTPPFHICRFGSVCDSSIPVPVQALAKSGARGAVNPGRCSPCSWSSLTNSLKTTMYALPAKLGYGILGTGSSG